MKGVLAVVATVVAAVWQVTVAPLFPVGGVTFDFLLLSLVVVAAFGAPRRALVCVPVAALAYGFLADRAPGLVLLAYLPMLPLGVYLEQSGVPLNHFAQTAVAMVATGAWVRLLLVLSAVLGGADGSAGVIFGDFILPGMFLDFALLSVVYVPLRLLGWSGQGMSLKRGSYYSSL